MKKNSLFGILFAFLGVITPSAHTAEVCSPDIIENIFVENSKARAQIMERSNEIFQTHTKTHFEKNLWAPFLKDFTGREIESSMRQPFITQNENYKYNDSSEKNNHWSDDVFDNEVYTLGSTQIELGSVKVLSDQTTVDDKTFSVKLSHAIYLDQDQANNLSVKDIKDLEFSEDNQLADDECLIYVSSIIALDFVNDDCCSNLEYIHGQQSARINSSDRRINRQYRWRYNTSTKKFLDVLYVPMSKSSIMLFQEGRGL